MKYILGIFITLVQLSAVFAQEKTLTLKENDTSPKANLKQISWIAGHWRGEAFGGITEEVWSPALGNSMMGVFKHVKDNQVTFYEMMTIVEEKGSLIMRLKHFNHDLKGWEEKNETVDFPLVKINPNHVYFDGLTFERINENEMNVYVVIEENGKSGEEKFNYKKYTY